MSSYIWTHNRPKATLSHALFPQRLLGMYHSRHHFDRSRRSLQLWLPWDYLFLLVVVTAGHMGGWAQGTCRLMFLAFSDPDFMASSTEWKCSPSIVDWEPQGGPSLMPQGQKIVVAKGACRSLPSCNSCLGNWDAVHLTVVTSSAKKSVTKC